MRQVLNDSSCVRRSHIGGWDAVPSGFVTLLGDVAHVMLSAGPGANHVMADGADLGLALAKAKSNSELLEHVREYETATQERTRAEMQNGRWRCRSCIYFGAIADLLRRSYVL
jgi:2-polyprenyl-6-methoxyphenol hydroxylase-like FAD-dependent oxidoreductase